MGWLSAAKTKLINSPAIVQIIKYAFVGGVCTVLDFGVLYILTTYFGVYYIVSAIISFTAGTIVNYFLCTRWVFKVRTVDNRKAEFAYYLIITAVGIGITTTIIWIFTEYFHLNFMLSKLIATFITVWWNFTARKYFLHTIR
ncbi:MAG: GtrA family protein [Sphingobacteriaceae bacterium]|nr:MAG: GtrA family protein [Sphingobacteriaceae bacterium]